LPVPVVVLCSRFNCFDLYVQCPVSALGNREIELLPPRKDLRLVLDRDRPKAAIFQELFCDYEFVHPLNDTVHLLVAVLPKCSDRLLELSPQTLAANQPVTRLLDERPIDGLYGRDMRIDFCAHTLSYHISAHAQPSSDPPAIGRLSPVR
jgi:hypothetical protein